MIWILTALVITLPFAVAAVVGAPWLPTLREQANTALDLADLQSGQTIIDLGSGDGRLLIAAAQRGLTAIGYEINPFMYLISRLATWRYRHQIRVYLSDFWHAKLPPADTIYVFLIPRLMPRLEQKLRLELTRATPVISMAFELPGRQPQKQIGSVRLYLVP